MRGGGSILRQFSANRSSGKGSRKEWENTGSNSRKRIMIAVDGSKEAKHALLWALSHVVNSYDIITLLNVVDIQYNPNFTCRDGFSDVIDHTQHKRLLDAKECELVKSFKALCKSHRPEVDVEVLVTQGERATTIVRLAKKLEASLLVLGQTRPSLFERVSDNSGEKTEQENRWWYMERLDFGDFPIRIFISDPYIVDCQKALQLRLTLIFVC
ncbi:hypothetical protein KI387_044094 [Taxus chinensis]|uniref:UspA domain-containing protein n=1 Tax=Taxus chinensis TaxID=29808 RepID=A0AA38CEI9_TAXCH|nr:hypothetical protein KI387_044094 [Taxus chinensis]